MAFPSWSNRPYHYHHLGIPKWSAFCLPLLHCLWTDYNITCNAHLYQFPVPFAVVSSQNWVFAGAGELIPKQTGDPVLLLWFVIFLCSEQHYHHSIIHDMCVLPPLPYHPIWPEHIFTSVTHVLRFGLSLSHSASSRHIPEYTGSHQITISGRIIQLMMLYCQLFMAIFSRSQ